MTSSLRSDIIALCKRRIESTSTAEDDESGNIQDANARRPASMKLISRNPHTVLSLNPEQLSTTLQISQQEALVLRNEVADAISRDGVVGHSTVQSNYATNASDNQELAFEPFLAGGSNILQTYLEKRRNPTTVNTITTGSNALDKLVCKCLNMDSTTRKRPRENDNNEFNDSNSTIADRSSRDGGDAGIPFSRITQISGPSSCGKTQLALTISSNALMIGHRVRYIAAGGGSASLVSLARRLRQICSILMKRGRIVPADDDLLKRIHFETAMDAYKLLSTLHAIEHDFISSSDDTRGSLLIVIDSISGCLAPWLYGVGDGGVGAALMNEVHLALRRISRLSIGGKHFCVFITNGAVKAIGGNRERKPALGEMWRTPDVHLFLEVFSDVVGEQDSQVSGLEKVDLSCVRASSCNHWDRHSVLSDFAEFGIDASGIVDVKSS